MNEPTIKIICEECDQEFDSLTLTGTPFSDYRPKFCDPCVDLMRDDYLKKFTPVASNPIPPIFRDFDPDRLKPAARQVLDQGLRLGVPRRLLVAGRTGAGKSYLSVGLAQSYSEGSKRARWATGAQIKATLKPTDNQEQQERNRELIRMCHRAEWLCIDDLGHGNWTNPYGELILELINARHALQTVITTQFPSAEWRRHITGECSPLTIDAIMRRLDDYYAQFTL